MGENLLLAVIDVGLKELGGHHAGFAEFLTSTRGCFEGEIIIFASCFMDDALHRYVTAADISVEYAFNTEAYENFDQPVNFASRHSYILILAMEYRAVLDKVKGLSLLNNKIVCFYPSLNWDHALALALALKQGDYPELQHLVCAMFNPSVTFNGAIVNVEQRMNFRVAFNMLNSELTVNLYASGYELARAYQALLDLPQALPIHPCYLTDWKSPLDLKKKGSLKKILLYMGDAKKDKGFNALPEILNLLMVDSLEDVEFTVQFTLGWDNPEVLTTVQALKAMSEHHSNLRIIETFRTDNELQEMIAATDIVVFNYDEKIYQDKTSGVLWLVTWFNLKILAFQSTWLTREASRLGADVNILNKENLPEAINQYLRQKSKVISPNIEDNSLESEYRNILYQPFWPWLQKQWKGVLSNDVH